MQCTPARRVLSTVAPAGAAAPPLAPGALVATGNQDRFSLRAREVPPEQLQLDVQAQTCGSTIVAPLGKPVIVDFADLPAREGAARIGASLGGLVPLRSSWANPAPSARFARVETYYLVRPGSRRRQLLDAFALEQGGVGHQRLFESLKGEGAAVVPDAAAQARDATRAERERIVTIGLLGAIGGEEATAALTAILGAGPGTYVRRAAASALGAAGQAGAVPTLRAALADPDAGVALSAAGALGASRISSPGAARAVAAAGPRKRWPPSTSSPPRRIPSTSPRSKPPSREPRPWRGCESGRRSSICRWRLSTRRRHCRARAVAGRPRLRDAAPRREDAGGGLAHRGPNRRSSVRRRARLAPARGRPQRRWSGCAGRASRGRK